MIWLWLNLAPVCMAEIPETVVQISVYDLSRTAVKRAPRLPEGYGAAVARKVMEKKGSLLACLEQFDSVAAAWQVDLNISPRGGAQVSLDGEGEAKVKDCVSKRLGEISFPVHPLKKSVNVQFPLKLDRKQL